LDEPTIGLDAVVSRELRNHIKYLAMEKNKGILLTSHYMQEIEELCDYIYILNNGVLIKQGTAKELADNTFHRKNYVLRLYSQSSGSIIFLEDKLKNYDPTVVVKQDKEGIYINSGENISLELSRLCTEQNYYIREMYEKEPQLEDTILQLSKEVSHEGLH